MKKHIYSLTFIESTPTGFGYGNVYMGFDTQQVTLARINDARSKANMKDGATLTDCSYLGYMTTDEFETLA